MVSVPSLNVKRIYMNERAKGYMGRTEGRIRSSGTSDGLVQKPPNLKAECALDWHA